MGISACAKEKCCRKGQDFNDSSSDTSDTFTDENPLPDDDLFGSGVNKPKVGDLSQIKMIPSQFVQFHQCSPWEKYVPVSDLGSGSFGTVKKVMLRAKRDSALAVKVIPLSSVNKEISKKSVIEKINILTTLDHPNIMKVYEFYEFDDNIYIISEFCDNGNLLDKIVKLSFFSEIIVKFLMEQILNAVAYLHSKRILHGDLKLENVMLSTAVKSAKQRFTILSQEMFRKVSQSKKMKRKVARGEIENFIEKITEYEVKLIDFGCSKIFTRKKTGKTRLTSGIIGTSIYCSPEVVDNLYDEQCDEWSCGVIMYILLTGEAPFKGESEEEIFENIKNAEVNFRLKELENVSENCRDLMKKLLCRRKKGRITAKEALKHPFFSEDFKPFSALTQNRDLKVLKELKNLKKSKSKFYEAVVAYLCFNFIDKDEEMKLRKIFRYMDKGNTNILKREDLIRCLEEVGAEVEKEKVEEMISIMDTDGSGTIEYQEFLSCMCDKEELFKDDNLRRVFDDIDFDRKGYITAGDIREFAFKNQNISEEILSEYVEQFGMGRGEKLEFEKFKKIMRE